MKLKHLLLGGFGTVTLLIALIGGIAVMYSNQVSRSLGVSSFVPQLLLISGIIVLLLALMVGYVTSKMITKPLADLTKSNQLIIQGKFKEAQQQPFSHNLPKEIQELVQTREKALAELVGKQRIEETNKQLLSVTKQLESRAKFDEKKRTATLSILEDIDQQKKLIARANEQLYAESLYPKMNPGPAIQLDESGMILSANPSSEKVFGKAKGKSLFNLIGTDAGLILRVLKKDKLYQTEFLYEGKTYQFTFKWDPKTRLIYVYGSDITAIKKAEIKLRDSYLKLQDLDKLKNLFLSMTSHELKTPITPIKLQAQTMLSGAYGDMNAQQKKGVEVILRNIDHLNSMLSDVLDSAKLEARNLKLYPQPTDLKQLIVNTVEDIQQTANQKNISLTSTVPQLPTITIDPERIAQVLLNLLTNSMKFTPPGGKITVSAEKKNDDIFVSVKDNGMGIPKPLLAKIFNKFSQITPSYKRKEKGTGLGLAISKGIVEQHGGNIWAESEGQGKGSSFYFTLPIKKSSGRKPAPASEARFPPEPLKTKTLIKKDK